MRELDAYRFKTMLRPLLEVASPYDLTNATAENFGSLYIGALDEIESAIGQKAELKLDPDERTGSILPRITNIGSKRIEALAKAYDKVGSLLPVNPLYWMPATRKLFNLPDFDPTVNFTVRDIVSFEEAVKFTGKFWQSFADLTRPVQLMRDMRRMHQLNQQIQLLQTQMANRVTAPDLPTPQAKSGRNLDKRATFYTKRAGDELLSQLREVTLSTEFREFEALVEEQRQLKVRYQHRFDVGEGVKSTGSYSIPKTRQASQRLAKATGVLAAMGGALIINKMLDDTIFASQGADLIAQLHADSALRTEDGQVGRFMFSGTAPRAFSILTPIALGVAAGYMFPKAFDSTPMSGLYAKAEQQKNMIADYYRKHVGQVPPNTLLDTTVQPRITAKRPLGIRFNKSAAVFGALIGSLALKGVFAAGASVL